MDPKHSGDMFKHLEKQNELLMDAYRSMSHELHRLQVEEEMLMRRYYEFMASQGLIGTNKNGTKVTDDAENRALVHVSTYKEQERNIDPLILDMKRSEHGQNV